MAGEQPSSATDKEWSQSIAQLVADLLVRAKLIDQSDFDRAVAIAAQDIYVRLAMQDRPGASKTD